MLSKRFYRNLKINCIIVISFIILSILSVSLIWVRNKIYFTGDAPFHIQRIGEIIKSNYIFPRFAVNSFDAVGSSVMTVYPYLFLYISTIIFNIIDSIKYTLYITFIIGTLMSLIISYSASLLFSKNRITSYIFSLMYSLSYEPIVLYFTSSMIGAYWSFVFLPLVIFGFVYLLKYNKWLMLSLGLSAILCSSLITFIFTIGILVLWALINYKKFNYIKLKNLVKIIGLTIITTTFIWGPLMKMLVFNKLYLPSHSSVQPIQISKLIYYSIIPIARIPTLTIFSFLGAIIGAISFHKMNIFMKQFYVVAIFITVISTNLIPWNIFNGQFILFKLIRKIQFAWRLLIIPQLMLTFILSIIVSKYCSSHRKKIYHKIFLSVLLIIICLQPLGQMSSLNVLEDNKVINNHTLMKDTSVEEDYKDYFPKDSVLYMKMLHHHYSFYNHKQIILNPMGNGKFKFYSPQNIKQLKIPFLYYYGIKYDVRLNNKCIKVVPGKHQLMLINNVRRGINYLDIKMPLDYVTLISRTMSLFSIFVYILIILECVKTRLDDKINSKGLINNEKKIKNK